MNRRKWMAFIAAVWMAIYTLPLTATAEQERGSPADATAPTLFETILERDGFIDGIWFPWIDGGRCGHNLTGNDVMAEYYNTPQWAYVSDWNCVELDRQGADSIYRQIYNLKAMGYNMMAYAGSIYGEGVIYDKYGDVLGIKQEYLDNARRLLDMCRDIGMPVMWNVYFHCSTTTDYYGIDGWNITCRMLGDRTAADHYAQRFVKPLCQMLAEYTDVVALVSIADEPENEINDVGMGYTFSGLRAMYGVTQDDMVYFLQQINATVREQLPNMPRTVASNGENKDIYRDFNLDYMGHNRYADDSSILSVEAMVTDAVPLMTEYNVGGNVYFPDEEYTDKLIAFRENMKAGGYKGGFQWCWVPGGASTEDGSSGWSGYLVRNNTDHTSFRKTVSLLKYYMDDYRAAYRGEAITLDAPVLYANAGDGKVLFIPSKRATTITVQRSDDGGESWKTILNQAAQAQYVDEYLVGCYTDTAAPADGYCYRIIASDGVNTAVSAPNNVAGAEDTFKKPYVAPAHWMGKSYVTPTQSEDNAKLTSFGVDKNRPIRESHNLITNGSFETADGQWNTASFLRYASVVTDPTAPEGEKSLYFDTASQSQAGWYTFTVTGLKPNTEYTFSAWLKGAYLAADNRGEASLGVVDPDSGVFMVYWEYYRSLQRASRDTQQLYPTAWDEEWHLRSVSFRSGDEETVTIALYGGGSQMWVDGIALFPTTNGKTYENGESTKAIVSSRWENLSDAAPNAVADPAVDDPAYWESGAGYTRGFVQAAEGALQYRASPDPHGVRYTKWFAVKPNTDYYVSFTVTVTASGAGRVAVLDSARTLPNEVAKLSLTTVGTHTYRGCVSSGAYRRLGLSVVDLGGAATIDNVCFYEAESGTSIPLEPSYDGYLVNGDFETGNHRNWENHWSSNTVAMVEGYNSRCAIEVKGGLYTHMRQRIAVEPHTDYVVELWSKKAYAAVLLIKDGADTYNIQSVSLSTADEWTYVMVEFNSGDNQAIYLSLMGAGAGATYVVDDVTMYKREITDGLSNGGFEQQGRHWQFRSGTSAIVTDAHSGNYALQLQNPAIYGEAAVQTIEVRPFTVYTITWWYKATPDSGGFHLFTMDGGGSKNLESTGVGTNYMHNYTGDWQQGTYAVKSGEATTMLLKFSTAMASPGTILLDDVTVTQTEVYGCAHRYDTPYAATCTLCGEERAVSLPFAFGGSSVSADVSGLAFRFDAAVQGMEQEGYRGVYDRATADGYKLLGMGALVTNGRDTVDIPAVYLWGLQETTATFAVRIVEIPAFAYDWAVTATPYMVLEVDGVATTVYGEAQTCSYNDAIN